MGCDPCCVHEEIRIVSHKRGAEHSGTRIAGDMRLPEIHDSTTISRLRAACTATQRQSLGGSPALEAVLIVLRTVPFAIERVPEAIDTRLSQRIGVTSGKAGYPATPTDSESEHSLGSFIRNRGLLRCCPCQVCIVRIQNILPGSGQFSTRASPSITPGMPLNAWELHVSPLPSSDMGGCQLRTLHGGQGSRRCAGLRDRTPPPEATLEPSLLRSHHLFHLFGCV